MKANILYDGTKVISIKPYKHLAILTALLDKEHSIRYLKYFLKLTMEIITMEII